MNTIDLTEAVEAAARALWERQQQPSPRWGGATDTPWDNLPHVVQYQMRAYVRPIVSAALATTQLEDGE